MEEEFQVFGKCNLCQSGIFILGNAPQTYKLGSSHLRVHSQPPGLGDLYTTIRWSFLLLLTKWRILQEGAGGLQFSQQESIAIECHALRVRVHRQRWAGCFIESRFAEGNKHKKTERSLSHQGFCGSNLMQMHGNSWVISVFIVHFLSW